MKQIRINTDLLNTEARGFRHSAERLEKIGQELYDSFHSIDMEYSGRSTLNNLMINEIQQARQLSSRLETLSAFLTKSAATLGDSDKNVANGLEKVEKININIGNKKINSSILPVVTLPWLSGLVKHSKASPTNDTSFDAVQTTVSTDVKPDWPHNAAYGNSQNPYAKSGYGGQCTSFVWGRVKEKLGISLPFTKRANYWWEDKKGLDFGSTPRVNAIAVWAGDSTNPNGHVGYVEAVSGDIITFNEANVSTYNGSKYGGGYDGKPETMNIDQFEYRGTGIGKLLGYIYLD